MRRKLAYWIAPLTLSLAISAGRVCFAQAGLTNEPLGYTRQAADATQNDLLAVTVMPTGLLPADARTDDEAPYNGEEANGETAEPKTESSGQRAFSRIGTGVKISTLGAGFEVATPLAQKMNLRGGINMFRFSRGITNSGIHYNGQLHFQSAEAHLDFFPFGGFHVSPGLLFYNGNQLAATASVPGGQTFSLGGTTYESDPGTPVVGSGKLDFVKVSPSIMMGVGNLIPRNGRHFSFLFEVGGAYQGSARVALNLTGNVCDPSGTSCRAISSDSTVQANVQAQQVKIQKDVNPYRFFPVISLGFGFNF
jgi:hypothetical protein